MRLRTARDRKRPILSAAGRTDNLRAWLSRPEPHIVDRACSSPRGLPIVELLSKEANVVLQSDKMKDLLAHLGIGPVGGCPAKMAERIAQEADLYKGIISSRQISVQ